MADVGVEKKLKLANTRKRFKELQELKKKRIESGDHAYPATGENANTSSTQSSSRNTPVEPRDVSEIQLTPSFAESLANDSSQHLPAKSPEINVGEESTLTNYFGSPEHQSPIAFFDSISPTNLPEKEQDDVSPSLLTYFNTGQQNSEQSGPENIGLPKYFDNINSSETIWENTIPENQDSTKDDYKLFPRGQDSHETSNTVSPIPQVSPVKQEDILSQEYPEIQQNEVVSECVLKNAVQLGLGPFPVAQYFETPPENALTPGDNQKLMDYLGTTGATEEEKNVICHTNEEIDSSTNLTKREIQSNCESLRQLSDQLAQIIEPYEYSSSGSITDLEKRNVELAANLEKEKAKSEQLQALNSDLQSRIIHLEAELTKQELGSTLQSAQEIAHLKNELQSHLQTIGLLVAEKTELSSNLSQYEIHSRQKTTECEELQARLKASRSRVADLERELNNLKAEKSKSESMGEQYSMTLASLKQEYRYLRDQKEELAQDLLEVREKLKYTLEENVKLQQQNRDLTSKLALDEIKIQQLSSGGAISIDNQVEQLTQEKFSLESNITTLNQTLKSVIKERDESTVQYQQYAQQLNAQISNLSSKLEQLQQDKENLANQEQNRIKHIGELERQLQNMQDDQVTYATRNSSHADLRNELEKSRELCVQLQIEKTSTEENYTKVSNEKELVMKELEAKRDSISQLESIIEQLRGNQPDSVKLLATMESDKVAASRAIEQNKDLKQQLESMQEVFMKMDNDKVVLTENLKAQQQTNKELVEKLQKTELTLQSLADAIEIKDKELTHLREESEEMNRQAIQHEQLEDRLRHYEAHDNSAHSLQRELQEARQTIGRLTYELNKKQETENTASESNNHMVELTNEINNLEMSKEPQNKDQPNSSAETTDEIDRNENVLNKEHAMMYLEEKVKKTMQEIADLSDEKQRLEHIVLQLQGETETIGEYVALYQHQRMVLKQKAVEKDQQLKQLANDREQIKLKLDRLNELIRKLVIEKGTVPLELLQHNENLCEEHSKLNNLIIKPENETENKATSQTAEEIITLLSEIKSSNLVQPDENFHHCPWCSGQLITV